MIAPNAPDLLANRVCGETAGFSTFAVGTSGDNRIFIPIVVKP